MQPFEILQKKASLKKRERIFSVTHSSSKRWMFAPMSPSTEWCKTCCPHISGSIFSVRFLYSSSWFLRSINGTQNKPFSAETWRNSWVRASTEGIKNFSLETESIENGEWTLDYFHVSAWDQKDTVSSVYVDYILGVCPEVDQSPSPIPNHIIQLLVTRIRFLKRLHKLICISSCLLFNHLLVQGSSCPWIIQDFTNPSFLIFCRRDESHTWGSGTLMSH